MYKSIAVLLLTALLTACGAASVRPAATQASAKSADIGEFLDYQRAMRKNFDDGMTGSLTPDEVAEVRRQQDIVFAALDGVDDIEALDDDARLEVYNAQQTINGIITKNTANTPICRREATLGSHRQRTVCMTPAQRAEAADNAQRMLEMWGVGRKGGAQAPTGG